MAPKIKQQAPKQKPEETKKTIKKSKAQKKPLEHTTYIHKLVKQNNISKEIGVSTKAMNLMNDIVKHLVDRYSSNGLKIVKQFRNTSTLTAMAIKTIMSVDADRELAEDLHSYAYNAATKYKAAIKNK